MNSKISNSKLLVSALCGGLLLAGCDSITTVEEKPYTSLPPETAVLQGVVVDIGAKRAITLMNNGNDETGRSVILAVPTQPSTGPSETAFSFGSIAVGSSYNIEVKKQPFGKICVVQNGTGTVTSQASINVTVQCNNDPAVPRYNVVVTLPTDPALFSALPGAKVRITTEEGVFEQDAVSGAANVTFTGVLFNPGAAEPNGFQYTVSASTMEDGTLNRCFVTAPTNVSTAASGVTANPTTHVTNVIVGTSASTTTRPCKFTIGGSVVYSRPIGVAADPAMGAGGVTLELRDVAGKPAFLPPSTTPIPAVTVNSYSATAGANAFTFTTSAKSNLSGIYEVVVTQHPAGQRCIVNNVSGTSTAPVSNGTLASVYVAGTANPAAPTVMVYCRQTPAAASTLSGTYRPTSRTLTTQTQPTTGVFALGTPTTTSWQPFNFAVQNSFSSNMLTFFDDGTFLYGTHAGSNQIEHGFYEYVPATSRLRFTVVADSNTALTAETNGLTYLPGRTTTVAGTCTIGCSLQTRSMLGVVKTTLPNGLSRITGTFGGPTGEGTNPVPVVPTGTATPAAVQHQYVWELTEPPMVAGEMTGTFISQDHRRFWVWDYETYYGTSVSMAGGPMSMNDACFTMDNLHLTSGIYTRRGSSTGCYPWNRPSTGQFYIFSGAESIDFSTPVVPGNNAVVPGFIGRIPGGQTAFDGRSPSPIYFHIAPAATFFSTADLNFFQDPTASPSPTPYNTGALSSWCPGEILGIRQTVHGTPVDHPVYLCRTRTN